MSNFSISSLLPFRRVKIDGFDQIVDSDKGTAIFTTVSPDKRYTPICYKCGSKASGIHDYSQRTLRDISFGNNPGFIIYNYRKITCPKCGQTRVEDLGIINDPNGPRVTKRMANYIHGLCCLMPIDQVAKHFKLDWKTVKEIDKKALKEKFGETDYTNSGYLAIDEVSTGKYHKYMTVVLDFITGRVIWCGKDRKAETLDEFFKDMPQKDLLNIKAVTMDMWDPYIKSIKKWCPHAVIVFDKFHIIAKFNKVIDKVRRSEQNRKDLDQQEKRTLKNSRWILLKNWGNLREKEKPRLEKLLAINENLYKVYILKDELKLIWNTKNSKDMAEALDNWCLLALESGLKPVIRFVATLQKYKYGIITCGDCPIHTSKLEGTNNKIKEIKRRAYGYHDINYFKLKIHQAFPGL